MELNKKYLWALAILLLSWTVQAQCAFSVPVGWSISKTRWDGACSCKIASGLGVLKEFEGVKVVRFFYGRLKQGQIEIGVIEQEEGYVAGRFKNGQRIETSERQDYVDAFAVAIEAATQASTRFKKEGNKASASFYGQKAKELTEQLD